MLSRRDFLSTAAALGSSTLVWNSIPEAIEKAFSIDPNLGTTFLDAEHVVILMQENRSFDHAFGALRGVRGFRDPRALKLPSGDPVWFQPDTDGTVVPPFRLDMDNSNVTWIGGTPHSWPDQVDARNHGRYDNWLVSKRRGDKFPMTMGFFAREDIPFYYSLADAFTICDYGFCSSLTGTTPNRLHLWTGTIRESASHPARVQNGDTDYDVEAAWTTFPERLQDAGVTWKIYQNETSLDTGLQGEHDAWLSNFTDNPIEWFSQFQVRFSPERMKHVPKLIKSIEDSLAKLKDEIANASANELPKLQQTFEKRKAELGSLTEEQEKYTEQAWKSLSERERELHSRAFADNRIDPNYRSLDAHDYDDSGTRRQVSVPKGDVLAQFRHDVKSGSLPAVSWLVAPEHFSDHPGSAWFGAWYLSEALNILTEDEDVWKKTIFILCYDENDGFFDHIPPFIAPHPDRPETGKVSPGIDTTPEISREHGRDHSIGLGYRCPLLVASPWSRGGCVNSQVFDHTSIIMFVETWLKSKGKNVTETNISNWRRTVCGDLTSVFKPYNGEKLAPLQYLNRDSYIERIHKAKFKSRPAPAKKIKPKEIADFQVSAFQESGTRPSCPLPYELEANIFYDNGSVRIKLEAGNRKFKKQSAGGAFNLYFKQNEFFARAYAVSPGTQVDDSIPISGDFHVRIDGPNGFLREMSSDAQPSISMKTGSSAKGLSVEIKNLSDTQREVQLTDPFYGNKFQPILLAPGSMKAITIITKKSQGWYDVIAKCDKYVYRAAGRLEDGNWSTSDPAMGN
jgi:phospholipase C